MSGIPLFGSMATFDRFLFAFTIASHIIIVSTSIALIVTIAIAEFFAIRHNDAQYQMLANRLTKVFTISFGVGTASGIVMAVELVTLFPSFMTLVSKTGVIALFYFEVFAFFVETLALVLYVYYAGAFKNRYAHWVLGLIVAAGTLGSAVLITMVNAWMNTPNGFDLNAFIQSGGTTITGVDPWAPFATLSTLPEIAHVIPTTIFTGSMMIGGYLAYRLVRYKLPEEREMLLKGLKIIWTVSLITLIIAGLTGSNEMATLLLHQPLKYAAFDANKVSGPNLAEHFFGFQIPGMQSLLAQTETGITNLPGLSQFPQSSWPPLIVNTLFDLMVLGGMIAVGYFALYVFGWLLKKKPFNSQKLLFLQIPAAFGSLIVYEIGWASDELGRQPWIVYNVMTVAQASNNSTALLIPGLLIIAFYFVVIPATYYFFTRVFNSKPGHGEEVPLTKEEGEEGGGINYS